MSLAGLPSVPVLGWSCAALRPDRPALVATVPVGAPMLVLPRPVKGALVGYLRAPGEVARGARPPAMRW